MSSPIIIITLPPHPNPSSVKVPDGLTSTEVAKILRDAAKSLES